MPDNPPTRKATVRCPICSTLNRVDLSRLTHRPKCANCGKPILLDRPIAVTDQDLERVVSESEVPVVVDFYADWCGPCKRMAPEVDRLAAAWQGRALVAKLDTDAARATAQAFQIRGIPTVMVFVGGKAVVNQSGAMPYAMLEQLLTRASSAPSA